MLFEDLRILSKQKATTNPVLAQTDFIQNLWTQHSNAVYSEFVYESYMILIISRTRTSQWVVFMQAVHVYLYKCLHVV